MRRCVQTSFFSSQQRPLLTITLYPSLIANNDLIDEGYASDVLLHEMVHRIDEIGMPAMGTSSRNCEAWVSEVDRISFLIGLHVHAAVVRQKRIGGKVRWAPEPGFLKQRDLVEWPYSVRPDGYYDCQQV